MRIDRKFQKEKDKLKEVRAEAKIAAAENKRLYKEKCQAKAELDRLRSEIKRLTQLIPSEKLKLIARQERSVGSAFYSSPAEQKRVLRELERQRDEIQALEINEMMFEEQ